MTTAGEALQAAAARLQQLSGTPRLDADLLLAFVLRITRAGLIARLSDPLPPEAAREFQVLVERRANLEPIAYLTGTREFYGLTFAVDHRVLVPRPETELLVELALEHAARFPRDRELRVADIGTGSGAIAIAVAAHLPHARVLATDLSADALAVARANVERHGLGDRIALLQGYDLMPIEGEIDLLLSNPPYTMLDEVEENVRRHEPHLALDGGEDGLRVIRELIAAAPRYLTKGAMLVEIGAWQGEAVRRMAAAAFPGARIAVHRDLAGLDRVLDISLDPTSEKR